MVQHVLTPGTLTFGDGNAAETPLFTLSPQLLRYSDTKASPATIVPLTEMISLVDFSAPSISRIELRFSGFTWGPQHVILTEGSDLTAPFGYLPPPEYPCDLWIEGRGGNDYIDFDPTDGLVRLTLDGGAGDDTILGGAGEDTVIGGEGADYLRGFYSDDVYYVDEKDTVSEFQDAGNDTVKYLGQSYTLRTNFENLELLFAGAATGIGNAGNNKIIGNDFTNTLSGLAGNDILDGGWGDDSLLGGDGADLLIAGVGTDTLEGGLGDDTYNIDESDTVMEAAQAGVDTIYSSADIDGSRYANIENFYLGEWTMARTVSGNDADNFIAGNELANTLEGGSGRDTLMGGAGSDLYVQDGSDTLVELAGGGIDTVSVSSSYVLGENFENIIVTAAGDWRLTGNELANDISGNAGLDRIDGRGGVDTLRGFAGDDLYVTDGGDVIVETATGPNGTAGGIDTVHSTGNYTLAAFVEKLVLKGHAMRGTGNGLDNVIFGNDDNNVLDGRGGADTLRGGSGDDTYVSDGPDRIFEGADGGKDTVRALASVKLNNNIENLVAAVDTGLQMAGNAMANRITGGAGQDTLMGGVGSDTITAGAGDDRILGGSEVDYLTGGLGKDVFVFAKDAARDVIRDFTQGEDLIEITRGANDFGDLHLRQSGAHAVIDFGEGSVSLANTKLADMTAADFIFS